MTTSTCDEIDELVEWQMGLEGGRRYGDSYGAIRPMFEVLPIPDYPRKPDQSLWLSSDAATWSAEVGKFVRDGATFYRKNLI